MKKLVFVSVVACALLAGTVQAEPRRPAGMAARFPVPAGLVRLLRAQLSALPRRGGSLPRLNSTARPLGIQARLTAANQVYTDPAGDSQGGLAADIQAVTVTSDASQNIGFGTVFANRTCLGAGDILLIFLDVDQNPNTGAYPPLGAEYVIGVDGTANALGLFHWNGSTFDLVSSSSLQHGCASSNTPPSELDIVNGPEIGITTGFNFLVVTEYTDAAGAHYFDYAPDDPPAFNYQLSGVAAPAAPPPPPPPPPPPGPLTPPKAAVRLSTDPVVTSPALPHSGKSFTVGVHVTQSDTDSGVTSGAITCTARVGGKRLAPLAKGFTARLVSCTWKIPPATTGDTLSGSVAVTYQGVTAVRHFSRRVEK
jgi:hypothetical protein